MNILERCYPEPPEELRYMISELEDKVCELENQVQIRQDRVIELEDQLQAEQDKLSIIAEAVQIAIDFIDELPWERQMPSLITKLKNALKVAEGE